jgi:hypothetical protein
LGGTEPKRRPAQVYREVQLYNDPRGKDRGQVKEQNEPKIKGDL